MSSIEDRFETLSTPLAETDTDKMPPVAIIDQKMANVFGREAMRFGKHIRRSDNSPWLTIVGVVGIVKEYGLDTDTRTVKAAGIKKRVGWHTFRHSYATLLKGNGEDVKTVQESLRHSTFQITLDTYTQAIPAALRSAQAKIVNQITDGKRGEQPTESQMDPYWTSEGSAWAASC